LEGRKEPADVTITRPERELVRRSNAWRGRRSRRALELEKNSPLEGAYEGPSMASDTPRGAARVRLLDVLKPFELG
jgi:hypothetical protein